MYLKFIEKVENKKKGLTVMGLFFDFRTMRDNAWQESQQQISLNERINNFNI